MKLYSTEQVRARFPKRQKWLLQFASVSLFSEIAKRSLNPSSLIGPTYEPDQQSHHRREKSSRPSLSDSLVTDIYASTQNCNC